MLPSNVITVCSVARLDTGHLLAHQNEMPVGAATLTGRVADGGVTFTLEAFVLQPADPVGDLLSWLDHHLAEDGATIAGYQLAAALQLLTILPGAHRSPALRNLAGNGRQQVIDLSARPLGAAPLVFHDACAHAGISCAPVDPTARFAAWCSGDVDQIAYALEVDVIATWLLIMHRIALSTPLGAKVTTAMDPHLKQWLRETDSSAARFHSHSIEMIAG